MQNQEPEEPRMLSLAELMEVMRRTQQQLNGQPAPEPGSLTEARPEPTEAQKVAANN